MMNRQISKKSIIARTAAAVMSLLVFAQVCACSTNTAGTSQPVPEATPVTAEQLAENTALPQESTDGEQVVMPAQSPEAAEASPSPAAEQTKQPTETPKADAPEKKTQTSSGKLAGKIICIDPGHTTAKSSKKEPMAPNSSEMKAAIVSGTSGKTMTEEQLVLKVGLKLQKALEAKGVDVVMTRTTSDASITNIDRAEIANKAGADLAIRIHADGIEDSSVKGMSMLVPGDKYIKDAGLVSASRRAGEIVLAEAVKTTGAKNRGISVRNDMTGFNWSEVPVILIEMGFMTNAEEDKLLCTEDYQDKIVEGIVNGLEKYFS